MSNLAGTDPEVLTKNDLTITLVDDKHVRVKDADHKGGGNVRIPGGKPIFWTNATFYSCELIFRELPAYDEAGHGADIWPFTKDPSNPPNKHVIAPGASWRGPLKPDLEATIKYDVVLKDGEEEVAKLDPIIIVERRS